jgi:hypothetical protein
VSATADRRDEKVRQVRAAAASRAPPAIEIGA